MVIKLLGLGFKEYARDSFNLFDAIIVLISLVETALVSIFSSEGGGLSALRGIRLLRVFKLARVWKDFYELGKNILRSLKDISTFAILLAIAMFILCLLGLELFADKIKFDSDGRPSATGVAMRNNFDKPWFGFITIFIVFVGDDWNSIMYEHYRFFLTTSHL
jgi:hypothetical protein